jgi:hypothetical protein
MTFDVTEDDLHYLRSILGNLRAVRNVVGGLSLGGEVLADNIDWLDCFIDKHSHRWWLTPTTLFRSHAPPVFLEPRHWLDGCWTCTNKKEAEKHAARSKPRR